jgi:hypothetical protein
MTVVLFAAALTMIGNLAASGSICLDRLEIVLNEHGDVHCRAGLPRDVG